MPNKAIFLDRDNTLIEDPGYITDPEAVKLLPGVDLAIKSFRRAGFQVVVVTNQSAIARGMLTEAGLEAIHVELRHRLAEKDAALDAIYYCPFHPDGSVEEFAKESDLRKPRPGMLLHAAEELDIDLESSWMVGDSARDVGAGQQAGCRTIRLRGHEHHTAVGEEGTEEFQADFTARNLVDAARMIVREEGASAESLTAGNAEESGGPGFSDSDVRKEILRHVRQIVRRNETEEFCMTRLLGGVTQMFAGLFLLIAFIYAVGGYDLAKGQFWAIVAMVCQTASLTFFLMTRNKS